MSHLISLVTNRQDETSVFSLQNDISLARNQFLAQQCRVVVHQRKKKSQQEIVAIPKLSISDWKCFHSELHLQKFSPQHVYRDIYTFFKLYQSLDNVIQYLKSFKFKSEFLNSATSSIYQCRTVLQEFFFYYTGTYKFSKPSTHKNLLPKHEPTNEGMHFAVYEALCHYAVPPPIPGRAIEMQGNSLASSTCRTHVGRCRHQLGKLKPTIILALPSGQWALDA